MAPNQMIRFWCYIEGKRSYFSTFVSPDLTIGELKKQIYFQEQIRFIVQGGPSVLTLTKVNVDLDTVDRKFLEAGQYKLDVNSQQRLLSSTETISGSWPGPPSANRLHIFVALPIGSNLAHPEFELDIEAIDEKINKELESLRGMVETFLNNPEPRTWEPPNFATPSNWKFLSDLRIPCYRNGKPSLLFHNLDMCNDKEIAREIELIFGPGSGDQQFICNTFGSGKTRRMLEGLTKYWGFYLVTAPDLNGVGVRDLEDALSELPQYTGWVSDLRTVDIRKRAAQQAANRKILSKHLRKVLAARIVVFQLFLQLAIDVDGKLQEKHKHIWLLFQLSDEPVTPTGDNSDEHPFVRIISCLHRASDRAIDTLVRRLCVVRHEFSLDSPFVLGLDEAQKASRMYPHSFIFSTKPDTFRSIICEVFKVFTELRFKLVVSSTDPSPVGVENAMIGVSQPLAVELFHELGMFDTWPKLKSFLECYIPASILESQSGKCLVRRMQEYLPGRYRFSVSFVEYLLRNGLESPHKLLNEYIKNHIGCLPGDTGEPFNSTEDNLHIKVSMVGFEWSELELDSSAITEAVQIVQSHLLKGQTPTYGPVTKRLVEYGIARLHEAYEEYRGQIVEPLAFLSIMRWLQTEGHLKIEANLRRGLGDEPSRGSAFEEVGILYLLRALCDRVPFTSVFDFRCTPSWADEMPHIVTHLDGVVDVDVGVYVDVDVLGEGSVVRFADNIDDIIDWIYEDTASAILIPSDQFGPDVMARCHSSPSNETVLLMGQFKPYTVGNKASLAAETTANALTSLHPDHWFKQSPYHQRQKLIDAIEKHRVLRFVGGYPLAPDLNSDAASVKRAIDSIDAPDANVALASLRLDGFRANFKSRFEATHVLPPLCEALGRKQRASDID